MSPPPQHNLEVKARAVDLAAAQAAALRLGARPAAVEVQTDTYFRVPAGRLKLRAIEGRPAVLIWYDRPESDTTRTSAYHLVAVVDVDRLKVVLATALGVRGAVHKRRAVYLWHNVRIHFDEVQGLGEFIEFEAVLGSGEDEPTARARLAELGAALALSPSVCVAASYADLLGL